MSDFEYKYPQPVHLGQSAYDAPVPRSISSDLDFIEAQSNRLNYMQARIVRLEQLLRNREHSIKVLKEQVNLSHATIDRLSKTIDEKNKELTRLSLKD